MNNEDLLLFCYDLVRGFRKVRWDMEGLAVQSGEFTLLLFEQLGGGLVPIAVLLLDHEADKLHLKSRVSFSGIASPEDARTLHLLLSDVVTDALTLGGSAMLGRMENTLSNAIRIAKRTPIQFDDVQSALDNLYSCHIPLEVERTGPDRGEPC